jgi:hydroxymethylpyrimidine pyrophosphatase-like HAD family hydrolase
VEKMLAYYGIHRSQAIAFGDGGNDIEMLQTVGCGVAMGNASDKVKASADDVCGTVSEDGVYHYCVEYGLI